MQYLAILFEIIKATSMLLIRRLILSLMLWSSFSRYSSKEENFASSEFSSLEDAMPSSNCFLFSFFHSSINFCVVYDGFTTNFSSIISNPSSKRTHFSTPSTSLNSTIPKEFRFPFSSADRFHFSTYPHSFVLKS